MSLWEVADTSARGIKEKMKDRKSGALKTAKLNNLASKIRTKTINNSSIIKVTLKQNNKALAMALNAAKVAAHRLTDEKMLLQKEVERCHFESACLRQKLSSVTKYIEEMQQFMNTRFHAVVKLLSRSENGLFSLLLNDAEHGGTDNIAEDQEDDCCSSVVAPKPMRIPLSHVNDEDTENGRDMGMGESTGLDMVSLGIPVSGSSESQKSMSTLAVEKPSSSSLGLTANGNDGWMLSEGDDTASALNGDISSSAENSRSCSLSALSKNSPMQQNKITRPCSDSVVSLHGHVTQRKKHTTGVSTVFGSDFQMESLDNVLQDHLQGTKEPKTTAEECLEISQVGELVSLRTKNKSLGKIKAKEPKALNKVSMKTKNRDTSRTSKPTFDNYNNDATSESNKLNSSSKMKRLMPGESNQLDFPMKTVPLASFNQEEEHSSKHCDKTLGCGSSCVVNQTPSKHIQTLSEKIKNLESQFQNPETIQSNKNQQDEKNNDCEESNSSQCSTKTRDCRWSYVIVSGGLDPKNNCASAHKKNTHVKSKDQDSLFPSSESSSLNNKAPLHGFDTQHLAGFQKEIANQEETTLMMKRLKPKRQTQVLSRAPMLSETETQSLDDMQIHIQPEERKTNKSHKTKATKVVKNDTQEGHWRTKVDEIGLAVKPPRVSKRTINDLKASFRSVSQADTPTLASLGSMASALPVFLDDKDKPLDKVFRSSSKIIQKVQESAISHSSSFVTKTNTNSLEKTRLGANNHLINEKKKVDSIPKLSKRTTYTVSDMTELCVASDLSFPSPEKCKNTQAEQARWTFLRNPSSRMQRDSFVKITETPPVFDSLTKGPSIPDSSSEDMLKTALLDSCCFGSCSVLPAAKGQESPGRCSALPNVSAVFNKKYLKQMPSDRHEKKAVQASPESPLQNPALQENENQILKDLTNVNSGSCSSITSEISSEQPSKRRKKEVSYAEPRLNSKLRRGDPFTVTEFLSSPIYKTAKTSRKCKTTKKIKMEETEPSSDFMANQ